MAARFCVKCGKPLVPDAQFCAVCGAAVQQPPEIRTDGDGDRTEDKDKPPLTGAKRRWPVSPKVLTAVIAVFFVLVSLFAEKDRREAVVGFIETRLQEPVEALDPLSVSGHFFGVLKGECNSAFLPLGPDGRNPDYLQPLPTFTNPFATPPPFATLRPNPTAQPAPTSRPFTLDDACGSDGLWGYITRVPKAFGSTAQYVFSHGWASVVIVALPAAFFIVVMVGMGKEDFPVVLNPYMWLVVLPLFTGLFAWLLQLLVLLMLIVVKYTIASCALFGIALILFDKFKLWDDLRNQFDRAGNRLKRSRHRPSGDASA